MIPAFSALIAGLLSLSSIQDTRSVTPQGESLADIQCLAVVSVMEEVLSQQGELTEEQMVGLSGGFMYFYGRLEGREPGVDWLDELKAYLLSAKPEDYETHGPRCGKEMQTAGSALMAFGDKLGR